jgi:hypothetical protein
MLGWDESSIRKLLCAGRTALHAAALLSQPDLVALLLASGAAELPDDQDTKRSINRMWYFNLIYFKPGDKSGNDVK